MDRANVIVFGCGRKGSGKSRFLWDAFTSRAPRVLSLDVTGEAVELNPNAVQAIGWGQLMDALRRAADFDRWHIAAALEADDTRELFRRLAPPLGQGESWSRMFGGIALECGEVDHVAPNGSTPREVLDAPRRGRHHLLSMFFATQRPASCARDLTAMADVIFALQQTEPRDVEWLARTISEPIADVVRALPQYHLIYHTRADGLVYVCDPERRPYRILTTAGEDAPGQLLRK